MRVRLLVVLLTAGLISSATQAKCEDLTQIEPRLVQESAEKSR